MTSEIEWPKPSIEDMETMLRLRFPSRVRTRSTMQYRLNTGNCFVKKHHISSYIGYDEYRRMLDESPKKYSTSTIKQYGASLSYIFHIFQMPELGYNLVPADIDVSSEWGAAFSEMGKVETTASQSLSSVAEYRIDTSSICDLLIKIAAEATSTDKKTSLNAVKFLITFVFSLRTSDLGNGTDINKKGRMLFYDKVSHTLTIVNHKKSGVSPKLGDETNRVLLLPTFLADVLNEHEQFRDSSHSVPETFFESSSSLPDIMKQYRLRYSLAKFTNDDLRRLHFRMFIEADKIADPVFKYIYTPLADFENHQLSTVFQSYLRAMDPDDDVTNEQFGDVEFIYPEYLRFLFAKFHSFENNLDITL